MRISGAWRFSGETLERASRRLRWLKLPTTVVLQYYSMTHRLLSHHARNAVSSFVLESIQVCVCVVCECRESVPYMSLFLSRFSSRNTTFFLVFCFCLQCPLSLWKSVRKVIGWGGGGGTKAEPSNYKHLLDR